MLVLLAEAGLEAARVFGAARLRQKIEKVRVPDPLEMLPEYLFVAYTETQLHLKPIVARRHCDFVESTPNRKIHIWLRLNEITTTMPGYCRLQHSPVSV